jgi:(1->4)-alpha-D-glucan 1-alpha-D-glucosylmutase
MHGIELVYRDVWDEVHAVADATLRALLGAMEVPAGNAEEVASALAVALAQTWARILPPVIVMRDQIKPWLIDLRLPAALDAQNLRWILRTESGETHEQAFALLALPQREHAELDEQRYIRRELLIEAPCGLGYHQLSVHSGGRQLAAAAFAVAPSRCFEPEAVRGESRIFGSTLQLYSVRSERNWGIGDFTDLATVLDQWGHRGGGIVGVNPLHALFAHDPEKASPYSPSSRLFLNTLYLDVLAMEDYAQCDEARSLVARGEFQARLKALRDTELVDYRAVAAMKRQVLEVLYRSFRSMHPAGSTDRARAFDDFQQQAGAALRQHALYEALQERLHAEDPTRWGWPAWPEQYRVPDAPAVAQFAASEGDRIEFHVYLQWQADIQLARIGRRSIELGLGVGLYQDLAISVDRGGAEAWANQHLYALDASVGAPPDEYSRHGQDWGLPPLAPDSLRAAAYAPFIATLRANMRHSGALRIDHVMGLYRLFWIPLGGKPADGAYVRYPFEDLLGLLALESHRNQCMVVGEDLGTVPDEVRAALGPLGVLSYRLLLFERTEAGEFKPPAEYPRTSLVAASTHDLPTLAGFWEGRDILMRSELKLLPSDALRDEQIIERARDRAKLLLALEREQLLPPGATANPVSVSEMSPAFVRAVYEYLARSPAKLLVAQLEDVTGMREQMNMPGTTTEHPNWRRKLPMLLERFPHDEPFTALTEMLFAVRPPLRSTAPRREVSRTAIIPRATYRLQLNREFTFVQATAIVPYLATLGVSHVYCSPFLRAREGSMHGYDIVDHRSLNPEIGTRAELDRFAAELHAHGMGLVADVVPNHMGILGSSNAWWLDVLENGQASTYASFFDIDWNPVDAALAGKVLVPALGDHYGNVLERGELTLAFEAAAGSFSVFYFEHRFPIDPREYPRILALALAAVGEAALAPSLRDEVASLAAAFGHLPARGELAPERIAERRRDKEIHMRRLARIAAREPRLVAAIEGTVRVINGDSGSGSGTPAREAPSRELLHELLEAQAYRLAYWRVASDEINYRRFFDINDLAALRMEDDAVFEATHQFLFDLIADGIIDGLRIDHSDGLYDPEQYFARLQARYAQRMGIEAGNGDAPYRPLYIVTEKIVADHEQYPPSWAIYGTTGYRFGSLVNGLFVDAASKSKVERTWRAFAGITADFQEIEYRAKRQIMHEALASELTLLATRLLRLARADRRTRDFTFNTLREALAEVVACFPVYRTYITDRPSPRDQHFIDWAVGRARRRSPAADADSFQFIRDALLGAAPAGADPALALQYHGFALKAQQFTSPVTAKGVEDTAMYVYTPLASLNEVGGSPDTFGMSVAAFHAASRARAEHRPHTLLSSSTHDSKRSEDVRARIDVLSEIPAAWRLTLRRWQRINRSRRRSVDESVAPDPADEYLLYQMLLGTFPTEPLDQAGLDIYRQRIERYMLKAVREAKVHSSWITVNEPYEQAVVGFVGDLLNRLERNKFLDDLTEQVRTVAWYGLWNSLSMTIVKLTSPGVPDIYQGNELLPLQLVDPDNRQPVDFARRSASLDTLVATERGPVSRLAAKVRKLFATPYDGQLKLWVIWRLLSLRRAHPLLFELGDYHPLEVSGERSAHVVAYARTFGAQTLVTIAGRMFVGLGGKVGNPPVGDAWGDTTVEIGAQATAGSFVNVLTGKELRLTNARIALRAACADFPGAVLSAGLGTAGEIQDDTA